MHNFHETAIWITGGHEDDFNPHNTAVAFRKDFTIDAVSNATLRICAFYRYNLWVNGRFVCFGPARSFPQNIKYDEIDVTPYLQEGQNALAVVIFPSTCITGYAPIGRTGFIFDLATGDMHICSDAGWRNTPALWYGISDLYISFPTGFQEHYDAAKEPVDWKIKTPDFFRSSHPIGPVGTPPYKKMTPRDIPMLHITPITGKLIARGNASRPMADYRDNLGRLFNQEQTDIRSCDDDQTIFSNNTENVFVLDFAKTRYLTPGICVKQLTGNVRIELYYALDIERAYHCSGGFGNAKESFCDSFAPTNDVMQWHSFMPRGFRYAIIRVTGEGSVSFSADFQAVQYPYPANAEFTCSDDMINAVWNLSKEALDSCTNDAIVDTCARENVLWTMDACYSAQAAFYVFGETAMWRNVLKLIFQGIDPDGIPKAVVPSEYSNMCLYDQTFTAVANINDYYMASGDDTLLADVRDAIFRFLQNCQGLLTNDGLFVPPDFSWHFVDWANIDKTPYSLPINALLYRAADSTKHWAAVIDDDSLLTLANDITATMQGPMQQFFDAEKGRFSCTVAPTVNIVRHDTFSPGLYESSFDYSIHANSLALYLDCFDQSSKQAAAAYENKFLQDIKIKPPITSPDSYVGSGWDNVEDANTQLFGPGWSDVLMAPLFDYGYGEQALRYLHTMYGRYLNTGQPTLMETFDYLTENTAHAWGSAVCTLYIKHVLGIQVLAPGFASFAIKPFAHMPQTADYHLQTPHGMIFYKKTAGNLQINAPVGTTFVYETQTHHGTGDWITLC